MRFTLPGKVLTPAAGRKVGTPGKDVSCGDGTVDRADREKPAGGFRTAYTKTDAAIPRPPVFQHIRMTRPETGRGDDKACPDVRRRDHGMDPLVRPGDDGEGDACARYGTIEDDGAGEACARFGKIEVAVIGFGDWPGSQTKGRHPRP